jgi:glycosyltransferase involved in cell wall biosynthesis
MVSPPSRDTLSGFSTAISTDPNQAAGNTSGARTARPAILQVVPRLDTGGAERSTIDIAAALVRAGFTALVASEGGRMVPELLEAGGEWIEMPADAKTPHTLVANAFRLRDTIRTRGATLIHARSRAPAWSSLWAARMTHIPFVTTYHGSYSARSAFKRFYNSVMVRGDAVIANSQWTAEHIASQYASAPKRLVTIPRGVDIARFDPRNVAPDRVAAMRAAWSANLNDIVILLPGRLTRWKGQEVLIDAMSLLTGTRDLTGIRVVLAGDAQGRSAYESELKVKIAAAGLNDRVAIAGHVSDMPAAYLAADIVISASTQEEAFGRVAAEASAMERAVIATDHGGARETILPDVSGLLVAPGSAAILARALDALIDAGRDLRAAMGIRGRQHILQNFTVERMCEDTLALYRKLLAG